jgi:hypothetical protein
MENLPEIERWILGKEKEGKRRKNKGHIFKCHLQLARGHGG